MITKTKTQIGTLFVLAFLLNFTAQANPLAPAPDSESLSINLLGGNPLEIYKGSAFVDPGATVTDNVDAARTVLGLVRRIGPRFVLFPNQDHAHPLHGETQH